MKEIQIVSWEDRRNTHIEFSVLTLQIFGLLVIFFVVSES